MKILWIVNMVFPEALSLLHNNKNECLSSGGWLVASASALVHNHNVSMYIVAMTQEVKEYTTLPGNGITYILIPPVESQNKSKEGLGIWQRINNEVMPDVVHIHGTENTLGLSYINECGNEIAVLSVQGIMGLIGSYYDYGLAFSDVLKNLTLYDVIRRQSIWDLKKDFIIRGKKEEEVYRKIKYVIGRTETDKAHVRLFNPEARYFHCDEILRAAFYDGEWSYDHCIKHTIFMSQASYPVKGLHQVLKVIPELMKIYPDLNIRIAGRDFTHIKGFRERLKYGGYAKLIGKVIKKYNLSNVVTFTGPLNAEEMKQEYLRANVFLSASTIENSPNSLAEAQLLGVPCLASYVGGVPDMIPNKACGEMYRFEDTESLIYKIMQLFDHSTEFDNNEMRRVAKERHSIERHVRDTLKVYEQIMSDYQK